MILRNDETCFCPNIISLILGLYRPGRTGESLYGNGRMKINRTYLSRAINNCSGKNFNVYINEFRIKEAIKLMSADDKKFSLEGFAFETGFNERKHSIAHSGN